MKRIYNIGYDAATRLSIKRTLSCLDKRANEIRSEDWLLWKSTAIGHLGWLTKDESELDRVIHDCEAIQESITADALRQERASFNHALRGRLGFLRHDMSELTRGFEAALELTNRHSFFRSHAHIKVMYAEHLAELGEWSSAVNLMRQLLSTAAGVQTKTILLLRAIILLLESPKHFIKENEMKWLICRYHLLLYAMGLTQSQTLYPLLHRAVDRLKDEKKIDLYGIDLRADLQRIILDMSWEEVERILEDYYVSLGCRVVKLPKNFPAFDLLVRFRLPDGTEHSKAIQVKAWRRNKVRKGDIPDEVTFAQALEQLRKDHSVASIDSAHWYVFSDIDQHADALLKERIRKCFGCHTDITKGIDMLVDFLMDRSDMIVRINSAGSSAAKTN